MTAVTVLTLFCLVAALLASYNSAQSTCSLRLQNFSNPLNDGFTIRGPLTYLLPNSYGHNPFNEIENIRNLGACVQAMVSFRNGVLRSSIYCTGTVGRPAREPFYYVSTLNSWNWQDCTRTNYRLYLDRKNRKLLLDGHVKTSGKNSEAFSFGAFAINMNAEEARSRYPRFGDDHRIFNRTKCSCNDRSDFEVDFGNASHKSGALVTLHYVAVLIGITVLFLVVYGCVKQIVKSR